MLPLLLQLCATGFAVTLDAGQPFFIGTATAGTAGGGQVLVVDRVAGIETPAEVVPGSRVVVVLRERGADCVLRPRRGPAAFLEPGARRFVSARLLDRREWLDDLPTFEAHSLVWQVYDPASRPDAALTLHEIFEAFDRLPTRAALKLDGERALRPFLEWTRAEPGRAARYPLPAMTAALRAMLEPTNRPTGRRTD